MTNVGLSPNKTTVEKEYDRNPWDLRPKIQSPTNKYVPPCQTRLAKKLKQRWGGELLPCKEFCGVNNPLNKVLEKINDGEYNSSKLQSENIFHMSEKYLPAQLESNHAPKNVDSFPLHSLKTSHLHNNGQNDLKNNTAKEKSLHIPDIRHTVIHSHVSKPLFTKYGSLLGCHLTDETNSSDRLPNSPLTYTAPINLNETISPVENPSVQESNTTFNVGVNHNILNRPVVDSVDRPVSNRMQSNRSRLPVNNYVKLNLKKKQFSAKGSSRQRALRRKVYFSKLKRKLKNTSSHKTNACFICGISGHWANKCPRTIMKPKTPITNFPSLQKCNLACKLLSLSELDDRYFPAHINDILPTEFINSLPKQSFSVDELSLRVQCCLKELGFGSFRPGQELVILRTLLGISTLAVMPTAYGKSLCYQIPAVIHQQIYKAVALVISPLISLMEDQVTQPILGLRGAFLNSSQSADHKKEILEAAHRGQYSFLMLSPEALVDSDWLLQSGRLPPISFVCIDEAHCLADWSNHFRPSYLRVCNLLRKHIGVNCFLGLSATCTPNVITNICNNLGIHNPTRFVGDIVNEESLHQPGYVQPVLTPLPSHLTISASMDDRKDEALLNLLTTKPFNQLTGGILVYCATREQTEHLASYIRTSLQERVDQVGSRRMSWTTSAYHAGQTTSERSRIQKRFMNGKIRVLIATCAFGMGLNKPDLQAVIHFSLTKSFENYVQEIGRVGRKQQASYCHAFLPPSIISDPQEANHIRRHVFANHVDSTLLKRLLMLIFKDFKCTCRSVEIHKEHPLLCRGHVHAIDLQVISEQVDMKPESLATILAYMELESDNPLISLLHSGYAVATVSCYGGQYEMAYASQQCLAVSAAVNLWRSGRTVDLQTENEYPRQLRLDLPQLFNRWGWKPNVVKQELKKLEWDYSKSVDSTVASSNTFRTGINIDFSHWSLWLWIHGSQVPITDERLDTCLTYLNNRLRQAEEAALLSIEQLTLALGAVAQPRFQDVYPVESNDDFKTLETACKESRKQWSSVVHEIIKSHFSGTKSTLLVDRLEDIEKHRCQYHWPSLVTDTQIARIQSTVRDFLRVYESSLDRKITGRTIANIFHGISTPHFCATTWSQCRRFWKTQLDIDWPTIKKIATQELLIHFSRT
ncbi:ATP-dependent DNA helicase Q4 [Schistosoma japonicum]|nr:ATP-dependent DNA helicase Q4 [Schistosoma japonicum]KAH8875024.1 ATP-dependent DNA helicase Q4 [Schistosoma japonicum]